MLDIFIDMTNTAEGHFGNDDGGRCAVGSILWEIGIPHDRLLPRSIVRGLSEADQILIKEHLPLLYFYESDIATSYDCMVGGLEHPGMISWSIESMTRLRHYGKLAGINFIIASPLPKKAAVRTRELVCNP